MDFFEIKNKRGSKEKWQKKKKRMRKKRYFYTIKINFTGIIKGASKFKETI